MPGASADTLCLRPLEPELASGCVLVWKKNLTLSPTMGRFIEHVKACIAETGKGDMDEDMDEIEE